MQLRVILKIFNASVDNGFLGLESFNTTLNYMSYLYNMYVNDT
jgi:hypothetical protein